MRRHRVLARNQRTAPRVAGTDFRDDMNGLVGEGAWSYEEEWPAIRVKVPFKPGSEIFDGLEERIRNLPSFPCHLDIILEGGEGFILDESKLDQDVFHAE